MLTGSFGLLSSSGQLAITDTRPRVSCTVTILLGRVFKDLDPMMCRHGEQKFISDYNCNERSINLHIQFT